MSTKAPTPCIDLVVYREGKILFGRLTKAWAKDAYPLWILPGSDIFLGETFVCAAERQVKELLNMKLRACHVISVNANFEFGNHYIAVGMVVGADGEPENMRPDEFEKWQWFGEEDMPPNLFASSAHTIECYKEKKSSCEEKHRGDCDHNHC